MHDVRELHPNAVRYAERNFAHNAIQKILVIVDPRATTHPCIEKAARLASAFGSSLELYACEVDDAVPESWAGGTSTIAYRGLMRERRIADLEALANPLRARGLGVITESEAKSPFEETVVAHAIRAQADLVIKDVERYPSFSRTPAAQSDWILIRQMPVPLLLVKPHAWPSHPRICAAVDPCHPADRPATLDESLIATARSFGLALSGDFEVVHTLQPPPHLPGDSVSTAACQKAHAQARHAVEQLADQAGLAREAVHFLPERIPDGILKLAVSTGADILVMGSAGRPRFQYSAASTASLVLEQLDSDLLIVKAPGFISPLMLEEV